MKKYTSPGETPVAFDDNAVSAFISRAESHPDAPALAYRDGNRFVNVSTREMLERVEAMAAGLIAGGLDKGDRVAIYSGTRMEFTLAQYAVWLAGGVPVTIYETSSPEQVEWILSDSGAMMVFCENDELKAVVDGAADGLKAVFVIDSGGLVDLADSATDDAVREVAARIASVSHDDLALLIYTSGTTGKPKGCMLTHYNFIWGGRQVMQELHDLFTEGNSTLMFLPLAHSFAQVVQFGCVTTGVTIGYSTGVPQLVEELAIFKPRWVFSVPRVFEKVFNTAKARADADGKGSIFDLAAKTAISYAGQDQRGSVKLGTRLAHGLFNRLVYGKLRGIFGGRLEYAISGGAALGDRLGFFYKGLGITVLEGYGLTETTAATFFNRPDDIRIGTVGRPVSGGSVAIAEDGEVLIKGGCVFRGYWKNERATAEVFDEDGWFHSGDIGEIDKDGYLRITGRKKELIVTAGGKNVAPAVLEDRMRAHALISQCMVVGDAQPFISALVTIDPDVYPAWAAEHGKPLDLIDALDDEDLRGEIQKAVDDANKAVSKAESVRTFRILPQDFTIEGGELTPTLKVKRGVVSDKYADVIEAIYTK
ncbi:MAG TPA: long-chain fatty acid--CoA ligase [Acidimicrobiia bacterium]|nr:long-chain fatty acid--CoA ligase [Acidimicrobiia bacterium]